MNFNGHRLGLDTASASLNESRVTLVEDNSYLTANKESMSNVASKAAPYFPPRYTWIERLLGMFKRAKQSNTYEGAEVFCYPSPISHCF